MVLDQGDRRRSATAAAGSRKHRLALQDQGDFVNRLGSRVHPSRSRASIRAGIRDRIVEKAQTAPPRSAGRHAGIRTRPPAHLPRRALQARAAARPLQVSISAYAFNWDRDKHLRPATKRPFSLGTATHLRLLRCPRIPPPFAPSPPGSSRATPSISMPCRCRTESTASATCQARPCPASPSNGSIWKARSRHGRRMPADSLRPAALAEWHPA